MPCSDGREPWNTYVDSGMKKRLDDATKMACAALTFIEDENDNYSNGSGRRGGMQFIEDELGSEVYAWWKRHKKEDEERKALLKQTALAKLTPEEREVLGYK